MTAAPRPAMVPMYCYTCHKHFDLTGIDEHVRADDINPSVCPHCGHKNALACQMGRIL